METHELTVEKRSGTGKGAARKTRASGRIPGVIYGKGIQPIPISLFPNDLRNVMTSHRGVNSVLNLILSERDTLLAMVQDVQVHPLSRHIIHADFVRILESHPVAVRVRVELVGRSEGVKAGGLLQPLRRTLTVRCLPKDIPDEIQVDVSHLNIGETVRVKDIPQPPGLQIVYRTDFALATVLK